MPASVIVLSPEGASPTVHLRLDETQQGQHIELQITLAPSCAPRAEVSPPTPRPVHRDNVHGQGWRF